MLTWCESEARREIVVACVVAEGGAAVDEAQVRAFVSKRLSSYKVPRRVLFLAESDLTLTGSSKVKTAPHGMLDALPNAFMTALKQASSAMENTAKNP